MDRRAWTLAALAIGAALLAWVSVRPGGGGSDPTDPASPAPAPPAPVMAAPAAPTPGAAGTARVHAPQRPAAPPAASGDDPTLARIRALDAELAAFQERTLDPGLPEGAPREEEDAALKGALAELTTEFTRLERRYTDLMAESIDPRAKVLALISVGDLRDALGFDLEDAPVPSYLNDKQAEVYRDALAGKADAQYQNARDAWDEAAELAADQPPDPEIQALLAEREPPEP